jgi:3-hydroxyisobutyrate dehydrogenase-like beta-hydroxyacid dehydrogenase
MKVAFLGLGKMGSAMARNLLQGRHEVTVYNRTRDKAEALAGAGARIAASVADAVRDCEVAMTMLADDRAVEATVFGDEGVAAALPPARRMLAAALSARHSHGG